MPAEVPLPTETAGLMKGYTCGSHAALIKKYQSHAGRYPVTAFLAMAGSGLDTEMGLYIIGFQIVVEKQDSGANICPSIRSQGHQAKESKTYANSNQGIF